MYGSKTISAAVERVRCGESIAKVARSIGANRETVSRWCADADVIPARAYTRWSPADEREFARLWDSGMTYREMGERMGRSVQSLVTYARNHRERFPTRPRGWARRRKGGAS
jgi:DNA-binding CsgD family transcriptional regulator